MQQSDHARSSRLLDPSEQSQSDDPAGPTARLARLSRDALPAAWIVSVRAMAGLLQALALFGLYAAAQAGQWPATEAYLFCPALLLCWVVPVLFVVSWGVLSQRQLMRWLLGAALVLILLAVYDVWRAVGVPQTELASPFASGVLFPSAPLSRAVLLGVFMAQVWRLAAGPIAIDESRARHAVVGTVLNTAPDTTQRPITRYARWLDCATHSAARMALSMLFIGMVCLVLLLGAGLFYLSGSNFLQTLMSEPPFMYPVIAISGMCALHLTEGQFDVIRELRILVCRVVSWALPLAVLIVTGFGLYLFQTGLDPLWTTGYATTSLLGMVLILVVLINASYQDGAFFCLSPWLRRSARIACLLLLPLVCLAAVAVGLRVNQYGWSGGRVWAALLTVLLGGCSVGYVWAAVASRRWLGALGAVNSGTLFVAWLLLLAVFSPLLDPSALSVRSQLARLASGATSAEGFDFDYLRFEGQRFGQDALLKLAADGETGNGGSLDRALTHDWVRNKAAETLRKMQADVHPTTSSDDHSDGQLEGHLDGAQEGAHSIEPSVNAIANPVLPDSPSHLKMPGVGAAHTRSLSGSRPDGVQGGQSAR